MSKNRKTKNQLRITIVAVFALVLLLTVQCSNPFKSDEKKELVIHLIDDVMEFTGRWVFYWDGKDEKGRYIEPGKYIVVLTIKDWQDQLYVSADPGGKPDANYEQHFEPGFWANDELELPHPDPFQIQAGVNIPILIARAPARVKIDIYKD